MRNNRIPKIGDKIEIIKDNPEAAEVKRGTIAIIESIYRNNTTFDYTLEDKKVWAASTDLQGITWRFIDE